MDIRKMIAMEGIFVFLFAILGLGIEQSLVHVVNFIDRTSGEWRSTPTSLWIYPVLFISIGYIIRLIIWAIRTLNAK